MSTLAFNFTKSKIADIPYAKSGTTVTYRDTACKGLKLKVGKERKTFVLEKRIKGGKTSAVTFKLGIFSYRNGGFAMDLKDARQKALHFAMKCAEGKDPRKGDSGSYKRPVTLQEAYEAYLEVKVLRPNTHASNNSLIKKHVADWMNKDIRTLTPDDLVKRFRTMQKKTPVQATSMLRFISTIWNTASPIIKEGGVRLLPASPVPEAKKTIGKWRAAPKRRPVIPERLLGKWVYTMEKWRKDLSFSASKRATAGVMLISLFCGLRSIECRTLQWKNVDLDSGILKIEQWDAKNHSEHNMPICSYAKALFEELEMERKKDCPWVFSGIGGKALSRNQPFHKIVSEEMGLYLRPHATRRTFLSIGNVLGIPTITLKRLVNHLYKGDVTEQYILSAFNPRQNEDVIEKIGNYIVEKRDTYEASLEKIKVGPIST